MFPRRFSTAALTGKAGFNMDIRVYLDDLETRIDIEQESRLLADWRRFVDGEWDEEVFNPRREHAVPPAIEWPCVEINDTLDDDALMLYQQFKHCSDILAEGGGRLFSVRSNYGTGILPSVLGAEMFVMERNQNTLPTTRPLGADAAAGLAEKALPELESGLGAAVLRVAGKFARVRRDYPKLGKFTILTHPDMQGPMDICELLWGSDLFVALFDEPEKVHALLRRITKVYVLFMERWLEVAEAPRDFNAYFGMLHKGLIMLRNDSAMNLSPEMFEEFIEPYDRELLGRYGGGVHFCGRGDHYIGRAAALPGVTAVNLTQPEYNDMEKIFEATVDKGVNLIGLSEAAVTAALASGRPLHGRVHQG